MGGRSTGGSGGAGTGGSALGNGGATGGAGTLGTGGSQAAGAGGLVNASGGAGGKTSADGGNPGHGGTPSDGVGGNAMPDGSAGQGGSGGAKTGGRTAGACQAGSTYPSPVLTGKPTLVFQPTGSGSGTYEGPVWLKAQGLLLFSDMTFVTGDVDPSQVLKLTPPGTESTYLQDSGTNGMAVDGTGTLFACSHKVQGIVKLDFNAASLTTVVDSYNGKKFNSPNDLTIRSDGTIYFTDPDFQLGNRTSQIGKKGIYRVSPAGQVALVDDTFAEPNGATLSPDESVLYVADYDANAVRTFTVASDGSTSNRKDFVSVSTPDGFAVDCTGNLYVASGQPGIIQVYSPSGSKLGSITVAPSLSNLAFGGSEGKTLYITAGKALYSLDMNVPGYYY